MNYIRQTCDFEAKVTINYMDGKSCVIEHVCEYHYEGPVLVIDKRDGKYKHVSMCNTRDVDIELIPSPEYIEWLEKRIISSDDGKGQ